MPHTKRSTFFLRLIALYMFAGLAGYYSVGYALLFITPETGVRASPLGNPAQAIAKANEILSPQVQEKKDRAISATTIAQAVPTEGKFITADLVNMKLALYLDGKKLNEFDIQSKGRPGTKWETPSGFYTIKTKEESHFSSIGKVYMPYSMQFYGNYFIHGWTLYPDGTPTSSNYSGGCIKLHTEDAQQVFSFAKLGTGVFVYDKKEIPDFKPLSLSHIPLPPLSAKAFLIADVDTGDVYLEKNAQEARPIASITKLMTALVANESISLYRELEVAEGGLVNPPDYGNTTRKTFVIGDLLYPLLMQSSNSVAKSIASYYGEANFIGWMNATAAAHGMKDTRFSDASGISAENVSTPDDLFRLASYIADKKAFLFSITVTPEKTITATDGSTYAIKNLNKPVLEGNYIGGKTGHTTAANDTMVSILSIPDETNNEVMRRVVIIVLGSNDRAADTRALAGWIEKSARVAQSPLTSTAACASCAQEEKPKYRKVEVTPVD